MHLDAAQRRDEGRKPDRVFFSASTLAPRPSSALVERLSERELEVLCLVAAGLNHKKVAAERVISLSTVRHHARNIYGKLDVHSRALAAAKAQDLGLL